MIVVDSVSKRYRLYRTPADRLKELVFTRSYHIDYQALAGVSFTVGKGESLGIIGRNGAGKSSILKILCGVILPDTGSVKAAGKVTGLLELGTGFNHEMSGTDNIFMNGILIGMSRDELQGKLASIISFSELGDFIHEPMKTYSSGMMMRLAFSIAIHADPDCFIIDEALAVGDAHFVQKCMRRIREFRQKGGSLIFVSHSMEAVKMICDKAILLEKGVVVAEGLPEDVVNKYNYLLAKMDDAADKIVVEKSAGAHSFGTFDAAITGVSVIGENSRSCKICAGESASVIIDIDSSIDLDDATVGFVIRDRFGQNIFGTNTYHMGKRISFAKGQKYRCVYSMPFNIGAGKYSITAAIHTKDVHLENCCHWWDKSVDFEVLGFIGPFFEGVCRLEPAVEFTVAPGGDGAAAPTKKR